MTISKNGAPIEVLLVEDNPGDVRLMEEALKESKVYNRLNVVCDGEEALSFLCRNGKYAAAIRPDIILLDFNLPKKHGMEVLASIKHNEELKDIPVVVLTTSRSEQDITKAYKYHANCYIAKPVDFDQFVEVVKAIENFWFNVAELPGRE